MIHFDKTAMDALIHAEMGMSYTGYGKIENQDCNYAVATRNPNSRLRHKIK